MSQPIPDVLREIQQGQGLGLAAAARIIPGARGLPTCNASTLFRWATTGVRSADGRRVKLESVRIGSRIVTSGPALERFILSLTEYADPTPAPRTPAARNRASERAAKQLEAMGC